MKQLEKDLEDLTGQDTYVAMATSLEGGAASSGCWPRRIHFRELSTVLPVFGKDPSVASEAEVAVARWSSQA